MSNMSQSRSNSAFVISPMYSKELPKVPSFRRGSVIPEDCSIFSTKMEPNSPKNSSIVNVPNLRVANDFDAASELTVLSTAKFKFKDHCDSAAVATEIGRQASDARAMKLKYSKDDPFG